MSPNEIAEIIGITNETKLSEISLKEIAPPLLYLSMIEECRIRIPNEHDHKNGKNNSGPTDSESK